MWFLDQIKSEWPVLSLAPLSFSILLVGGLSAGFFLGMFVRSEQIKTLLTKISLRDDQVKQRDDTLSVLRKEIDDQFGEKDETEDEELAEEYDPIKRDEYRLPDSQISAFEILLKLKPSTVQIETGRKTPKLLAKQVEGVFKTSGWGVQLKERSDTANILIVRAADKQSSDTITDALESTSIDYHSSEHGKGTVFFLTFPHWLI